ncbi:MAG: universal stress protein [Archaeoglobus sp.]|nr:universal stress protein [Archaeoglobus sp.]
MGFESAESTESAGSIFERVLIPTDFSRYSKRTLECGTELAEIGVKEVVLVHVGTYDPFLLSLARVDVDDFVEKLEEESSQKLDEMAKILEEKDLRVKKLFYTTSSDPAEKILEVAEREEVDLILMGSRGHGLLRSKLIGGISESVVRKSKIPVLLTKFRVVEEAGEYYCQLTFARLFENVLFATDTTHDSRIVAFLKKVAARGEIFFVHVVERSKESEIAEEVEKAGESLRALQAEVGKGEPIITWGDAVKEILKVAKEKNISLIVIRATGKDGSRELGKTADSIIRHSKVPVLVFK